MIAIESLTLFDQIAEAASQSEALQKAAEVNSLDKFQLVFRQVLESLFIERMGLNEELFTDYMEKPEMQERGIEVAGQPGL